jgi:hypothetical protein
MSVDKLCHLTDNGPNYNSMDKGLNSVADQLRNAIRSCGESVYAVAKGAGVDASVLGRFVRSERGINLGTAAKVCAYLGLTLIRAVRLQSSSRSRRRSR